LSIGFRIGLYVLLMDVDAPDSCSIRAWQPGVPDISEVFHAHIEGWSYPKHAHDTWTILILDGGGISFSMERRDRAVSGAVVTLIPPGVVHDGRPAPGVPDGFHKRNLYLDATFLPPDLTGRAVDRTNLDDVPLRRTISAIHDGLLRGDHPMHAEERLALVADRIGEHLRAGAPAEPRLPRRGRADQLRDLLDLHATEPYLLRDAATELGASVSSLVRGFRERFDLSPHAYLVGRRIEHARRLLLSGVAPAEAAVLSGFHDQAHLTRHFRRHVATTPGRYARGGAGSAA
jgi:AraC-like DNA-binding protein